MFDREDFERSKRANAAAQSQDEALRQQALDFVVAADRYDYAYQWTWLGLPMIQLPPDVLAMQEIVWQAKPDVIIETGIAWGGSIVFYASLLQLLGKGKVIGVDLVLPQKNRDALGAYPFSHRMELIEGSSTDAGIVANVKSRIAAGDKVMVVLDSNHTHQHVLDELRLYAPLVTKDQYLVVTDTIVEDMPEQKHRPRPWGKGDNPKTAIRRYLTESDRFELDAYVEAKVLTSFCPEGYYRCVKD